MMFYMTYAWRLVMLFIPLLKNVISVIVEPLLNKYSATGINFVQPLSAQAQQASKIYTSSA